jgi:hypothetical protein
MKFNGYPGMKFCPIEQDISGFRILIYHFHFDLNTGLNETGYVRHILNGAHYTT